ncbi:hypothetical protein M407DRAFT_94463 [Tulasnella calospora MUT 4182]|uniref:Uncharacterized protein n=1 Tax=Tulasnella calospora MUT 4182 TaxID=1051891 RepID=A0A0C3QH72_9AGAM|nr:hypothetical protein M407DRAFT_94463 [Tulasnella calospora MUT 4182]
MVGGRGLREELHSLGVSVFDCPDLMSTKTVADKMIIVDLFAFAFANRSSVTIGHLHGPKHSHSCDSATPG